MSGLVTHQSEAIRRRATAAIEEEETGHTLWVSVCVWVSRGLGWLKVTPLLCWGPTSHILSLLNASLPTHTLTLQAAATGHLLQGVVHCLETCLCSSHYESWCNSPCKTRARKKEKITFAFISYQHRADTCMLLFIPTNLVQQKTYTMTASDKIKYSCGV